MFDKKGIITVDKESGADEETLMMDALDIGAYDFNSEGDYFEIYTDPNDVYKINDALAEKGYTIASAEAAMIPQNYISLDTEEDITLMEKLLDILEDNEDVQEVYHNWEINEEE